MISSETIHAFASAAGFDLCGIAPCRILAEHSPRLERWLSGGGHSGLEYMSRYREKRVDPSALVENARTVIVCGVNYKNNAWEGHRVLQNGKVASYAFAADYHKAIKKMLQGLLTRLKESHPEITGRCFTDTAPILEKAWAVEAGLGWIGKNSLLVTPRYGSTVLLGEIVLDAEVDKYNKPFAGDRCGNCDKCVVFCPNEAINDNRTLCTGKCVSRMTIEKCEDGQACGDTHGWIFGCDVCQSCCPFNSHTPYFSNPAFEPVADPMSCDEDFWKNITEQEFNDVFGRTPLKRSGFKNIKSRIG